MSEKSLIPEEAHQRAQQQHLQEAERSEELAKLNHDFVQVQRKNLAELRRLIRDNHRAAQVLMLFVEKMNKQNALICSFKTLEDITRLSRSTLSKAINVLKQENWIRVIKVGTANAYLVNREAFWQDSADKKLSHFTFGATVIASRSEQDEEFQDENWKGVALRHFPFLHTSAPKDVTPIGENQSEMENISSMTELIERSDPS